MKFLNRHTSVSLDSDTSLHQM